jgi:hypothetical protein
MLRNWYVLGAVVPVRSNFGEELWLGNHQGGAGRIQFGLGPAENEGERERYRALGEISYVARRRAEAMSFISENPGHFLHQAYYRFRYWWFAEGETARLFVLYRVLTLFSLVGMVLALRTTTKASVFSIVATLIVYPIVYYITDVYARYRYPIEPLMVLLAAFAMSQAFFLGKAKIPKSKSKGVSTLRP